MWPAKGCPSLFGNEHAYWLNCLKGNIFRYVKNVFGSIRDFTNFLVSHFLKLKHTYTVTAVMPTSTAAYQAASVE